MGATLQSGPGRLAVGAVVGALTAALFTTGIMSGAASQIPSEQGDNAAVEPIPPDRRPTSGTVATSTGPTSSSSSTTSTTSATSTTTTTTTSADDDPPPVTTTTTTRHSPPPPTTTTRTTTTTTCSSLICVG